METGELTQAELRLVRAAEAGDVWRPDGDAELRADIIQALTVGELLPGFKQPVLVQSKGIRIDDAKITGHLDLESAIVTIPLWFFDCTFAEAINVRHAQLSLLCLRGCNLPGFHGHRLRIDGPLLMSRSDKNPFRAPDRIDLTSAEVAAEVSFTGAEIGGIGAVALDCNGAQFGASFSLRALRAVGLVDLTRLRVDGNLHAQGAVLKAAPGQAVALTARGVRISGDASFREGFEAHGQIDVSRSDIAGSLLFDGARLEAPGGTALSVNQAKIGAALGLSQEGNFSHEASLRGHLDLRGAHIKEFRDDGSLWPDKRTGFLKIDGCHYERFGGRATIRSGKKRVRWLKLQRPGDLGRDFKAQPWEHLIQSLSNSGHVNDARFVAIAKEQALHRSGTLTWRQWAWSWFSGLITGYGFLPMRSVYAAVVIYLIGVAVFASANRQGLMAPSDPTVLASPQYAETRTPPPDYPRFNAWIYSLDVFLPVVDLHQESRWLPSRDHDPVTSRAATQGADGASAVFWDRTAARLDQEITPLRAQAWLELEIILGWIVTSLAIAAFSGLLRPTKD
ncbi:MAG TPA: hypothetical protein DCL54_09420 [Alphaproteobacteria bacterium]|nr:hypothetical protein [Alphaproteobacteria bacterium]